MSTRRNGQAPTFADPFDPEQITDAVEPLPDCAVLYAPEGWGKTSFAAQAPDPLFLMSKGEKGLLKLIQTGQLPPVKHYPRPVETWDEVLRALDTFIVKRPACQTFILDVLSGFQRSLFERVCANDFFKGRWSVFDQFAAGPKACIGEWIGLMDRLDRIRELGYPLWALCHRSTEKVSRPGSLDYDSWQPDIDKKYLWPITHKRFDLILMGDYDVFVDKINPDDKRATKGKAHGGTARVLHCSGSAAVCAKNRHGLPAEIALGDSPEQAWADFQAAFPQPVESE